MSRQSQRSEAARMLGSRGDKATQAQRSPEQRRELCRNAARARWARYQAEWTARQQTDQKGEQEDR